MSHKKATFWKEYTINVKHCELEQFLKNNTIGDWLIYHRKLNNFTQSQLAMEAGFLNATYIKDIEKGRKLPGRDSSEKLATYFNLETRYFYDSFLEDTYNIHEKLKNYRKEKNLNIKQAAKLIGVAANTFGQWENRRAYPARIFYHKIKKLNIL